VWVSSFIPDSLSEPPTSAPITLSELPPAYLALSETRLGALHPLLADRGRTMLDRCARAGLALLVT
jgi:hypothetical protein